MPIVAGGGGGVTPTLAQVLAKGHVDTNAVGISGLGQTDLAAALITAGNRLQGNTSIDGPNIGLSSNQGGTASMSAGSPGAATSGGTASLEGGAGANFASNGALFVAEGGNGDGVTHGRAQIMSSNSTGAVGEVLVSDSTWLTFQDMGGIKNDTHAAPADGVLAAGDLYLWFDQSNGAAKLMVKAKQADGTVKAAAIALA